jgi:hypothetical protein
MSDIRYQIDGSMIGFCPVTEAGERFIENLDAEPWQFLGIMLWLDHRPGLGLLRALNETTNLIVTRY